MTVKKSLYHAPEAEIAGKGLSSLLCDSLTGGIDDYDLVGDYDWQDG